MSSACSTRRSSAVPRVRRDVHGQDRELDAARAARGDARARPRSASWSAGPVATRRCGSRPTPPTRPAARCCSRCRSAGPTLETQLLFFELEWAALDDDARRRRCSPVTRTWSFCAHHLRSARRYRPHLLTEPEEKVMAEKGLSVERRLGAAVRRADLGGAGRSSTARRAAGARAQSRCSAPTRELRARDRRGGHRGARARPAHARVHLQHARLRQVGR